MHESMITSLPVGEVDRFAFIKCANQAFEAVLARMAPGHVELARMLWNAERYVDNVLSDHMLPIERAYVLSLIQPSLVRHVAELAAQADLLAERPSSSAIIAVLCKRCGAVPSARRCTSRFAPQAV